MLDFMEIRTAAPPIFDISYRGNVARFETTQEEGRVYINPIKDWSDLSQEWQAHPESILEAVEELIYNACPELWILED